MRKRGKSERSKIIAKLDKIFSLHIRERDNWTCQRCNRKFAPPTKGLGCSHFWSRRHLSTRWDTDNSIALCMPCHLYHWESEKQGDYRDFMIKKLGEKKFKMLEIKAISITKISTVELQILYDYLKKEYERG